MTTSTLTLAAFLEARLTEDEVNATLRQWHTVVCDVIPEGYYPTDSEDYGIYTYPCNCGVPERMVREVASKRAIVEMHADDGGSPGLGGAEGYGWIEAACNSCGTHGEYGTAWPCGTVRAVAAVYCDHKDYQEEWS